MVYNESFMSVKLLLAVEKLRYSPFERLRVSGTGPKIVNEFPFMLSLPVLSSVEGSKHGSRYFNSLITREH